MTSPRPRTVARRRLVLGGGGLALAGLLAACAETPEAPPAAEAGPTLAEPTPNTTEDQLTAVVTEIGAAVAAADEARDAGKLAPRVVGSAAAFRKAMYGLIEKDDQWAQDLTAPGESLMVPMTSTDAEFPRTAIALVANSAKDGVPMFMALQQADARSPYTTWGWAQQASGVEMPEVPADLVGSAPVTPDTDDLLMTPKDALALYAKVLSDGDAADKDDKLAENPFQTETHKRIQTERKELNAGVEKDEVATIKEVFTVVEDEFAGLRTADGGAIVLATLTSVRKVAIKDGATVRYAEDNKYTTVIGTKEFTKEFIREFGTQVAVYIPAKDSDAQVQPIGATQTATGTSGS